MDADDEYFFVVRTVEDADAAALGQTARGAPEEIMFQLFGAGLLEAGDFASCGLIPDMTWRMAPSLPAASMPWKMSKSA